MQFYKTSAAASIRNIRHAVVPVYIIIMWVVQLFYGGACNEVGQYGCARLQAKTMKQPILVTSLLVYLVSLVSMEYEEVVSAIWREHFNSTATEKVAPLMYLTNSVITPLDAPEHVHNK